METHFELNQILNLILGNCKIDIRDFEIADQRLGTKYCLSQGQVSKILTGKVVPSNNDIAVICDRAYCNAYYIIQLRKSKIERFDFPEIDDACVRGFTNSGIAEALLEKCVSNELRCDRKARKDRILLNLFDKCEATLGWIEEFHSRALEPKGLVETVINHVADWKKIERYAFNYVLRSAKNQGNGRSYPSLSAVNESLLKEVLGSDTGLGTQFDVLLDAVQRYAVASFKYFPFTPFDSQAKKPSFIPLMEYRQTVEQSLKNIENMFMFPLHCVSTGDRDLCPNQQTFYLGQFGKNTAQSPALVLKKEWAHLDQLFCLRIEDESIGLNPLVSRGDMILCYMPLGKRDDPFKLNFECLPLRELLLIITKEPVDKSRLNCVAGFVRAIEGGNLRVQSLDGTETLIHTNQIAWFSNVIQHVSGSEFSTAKALIEKKRDFDARRRKINYSLLFSEEVYQEPYLSYNTHLKTALESFTEGFTQLDTSQRLSLYVPRFGSHEADEEMFIWKLRNTMDLYKGKCVKEYVCAPVGYGKSACVLHALKTFADKYHLIYFHIDFEDSPWLERPDWNNILNKIWAQCHDIPELTSGKDLGKRPCLDRGYYYRVFQQFLKRRDAPQRVVVFFDNIDHLEPDFVKCFRDELGGFLADIGASGCIVTFRPSSVNLVEGRYATSATASERGSRVLNIDLSPITNENLLKKVVEKFGAWYKGDNIPKEDSRGEFKKSCRYIHYLLTRFMEIQNPHASKKMNEMVEQLSNFNLRIQIRFFLNFCLAPSFHHAKYYKRLDFDSKTGEVVLKPDKEEGDSGVTPHELLRSMLLNGYKYYSEKNSEIINLFDNGDPTCVENQLLRFRVLQAIYCACTDIVHDLGISLRNYCALLVSQEKIVHTWESYVRSSQIQDFLDVFGYRRLARQLHDILETFLVKGLIVIQPRVQSLKYLPRLERQGIQITPAKDDSDTFVGLTPCGLYYMESLIGELTYIRLIKDDTHIDPYWAETLDFYEGPVSKMIKAAYRFLAYLSDEQEQYENKNPTHKYLSPNYYKSGAMKGFDGIRVAEHILKQVNNHVERMANCDPSIKVLRSIEEIVKDTDRGISEIIGNQ